MAKTTKRSVVVTVKAHDRASKQFGRLEKRTHRLSRSFGALKLAVAGASVALGYAFQRAFKGMVETGDQFEKFSRATGMSTEMLSGLSHAAKISGASFEAIQRGMKTFSTAAFEASAGVESYKRYFDALGISVTDNSGKLKNLDALFLEVADGMAGMTDSTERAALAARLFGRSGLTLMPMLREGSAGIQKLQEEARRLGITWSQEDAVAAAQFQDAMTRLKASIGGLSKSIMIQLVPKLIAMADKMKEWVIVVRDTFKKIQNAIAIGMTYVSTVLEWAADNWPDLLRLALNNIQLALLGLVEDVKHAFTVQIPAYLKWLADNWKDVFRTIWDFMKTFATNLGKNLKELWKAIKGFLSGKGWQFEWTGLLEGFESSIKEMPKIMERQLTEGEKELMADIGELGSRLGQELEEKLKQRLGALKTVDLAPEAAEAPEGPEGGGLSKQAKVQRRQLQAYEARFLQHAPGQDPMQKISRTMDQLLESSRKVEKNTRRGADATEELEGPSPIASLVGA